MEQKQQVLLNHFGNSAYAKFRELVSLDKRSLALFRILLACTCLFDIYDRLRDLEAHYSDNGILSRHEILANFHSDYWISAYMMAGTSLGVFLIFMVHTFCALMLLIGYRTNLFSALTFFFVISLQDRNYMFLHGGDVLQRVVMFFALFLPLGDVISVDQALKKKEKRRDNATRYQVFSVGSLAMIIQILSMYWIAHKLKTGDEWRVHYTSGWLALQLDFFLRPNPVITLLLAYPGLTKFFTWAVLHWQRVGCYLYFSPAYTGPCKAFAVLGFCAMHFTFAVSMRLGLFSWMTHTAALLLTPGWVWDTLTKYLKTRERTDMTIYYVDHCYYSHTAVKILKAFFLFHEVRISPLSKLNAFDEEASDRIPEHYVMDSTKSTWFMIRDHKGEIRRNSQAFVTMLRNSYLLFPLGRLLSMRQMTPVNAIIDRVALAVHHNPLNAFTFKDNEPDLPKSFAIHDARDTLRVFFKVFMMVVRNITAAVFLYAIITWNMGMFGDWSYFPQWIKPTFYWAHLDQSWGMFAPRPPSSHFWYNIDATLDNGKNVELFSNGGLFTWEPSEQTWQKPDPFHTCFKNHRWFKFFENGINSHPRNDILRLNFGRWICRNYNARHSGEERLYTFQLNYMSESYDGLKPFAPRTPNPKQMLWNHRCYDK